MPPTIRPAAASRVRPATILGILFALAAFTEPSARAADAPPAPAPAMADASPPVAPDGGDGALRVLADADAAPLLEGLKRAAKAKTAAEATAALDALAGVTHPDLEPLLARLLTSGFDDVAARAARCLGARRGEKTAGLLWRAWAAPSNARRWSVKAGILDALARARIPLDAKQYAQVERLWVDAVSAEAMDAFAGYFAAIATDKRPCKLFALWLDEPSPANVHDGANPPKEWWEARWKLWRATRPKAVDALKAITGQAFESSEQAQAWFAANRAFGVTW